MRTNTAVGALVVSGLAMPAVAQVSDVSLTFEAAINDLTDFNTGDPLGNESFVETGGLELLPYSRSAQGGDAFNMSGVVVNLSGELGPDGAFSGSGLNSASESFTVKPNSSIQSITKIDFTVTSPAMYSFEVAAMFDNDGGFNGISLTGPGGVVFQGGGNLPGFDGDGLFEGSLEPGEYQLVTRAGSIGSINYSFSIIPAPASGVLLGFAGVLGARRRR